MNRVHNILSHSAGPDADINPIAEGDKILLARIGAPHGVRGEVRVKTFTADPMAIRDYGPLAAADGRLFQIERLRAATEVVVAKFRGLDDRDAAEAQNGVDLFVDRTALPAPEEDEFYHADLIGLAAYDQAGDLLGTVVAVHDFGAGDILDITPPRGPSLLTPFTKAAVPFVDLTAGRLVVAPLLEVEGEDEDKTGREDTQGR
ncbi:MAG: ribosome maturation factor RimM [Rhizobiales bacterium]|nr:ribosome maturation factor RimM [Hyphomicrobiales bacterium]MDQ3557877.1 ribosome maturation factor RimM [Pseudomonadota bacterium]